MFWNRLLSHSGSIPKETHSLIKTPYNLPVRNELHLMAVLELILQKATAIGYIPGKVSGVFMRGI